MILLHTLDNKEILVSVKRISFVETTETGSKIEYSDVFGEYTFIHVKELPCQILLKINQNK